MSSILRIQWIGQKSWKKISKINKQKIEQAKKQYREKYQQIDNSEFVKKKRFVQPSQDILYSPGGY